MSDRIMRTETALLVINIRSLEQWVAAFDEGSRQIISEALRRAAAKFCPDEADD